MVKIALMANPEMKKNLYGLAELGSYAIAVVALLREHFLGALGFAAAGTIFEYKRAKMEQAA